jgi:hypothetical protein
VANNANRFLGDTPLRVFLKLLVISFLVGVVMSAFGWTPYDILSWVQETILRAWNMGFATVHQFIGYLALGAAIVVPIFIILRLMSYRK